MIPVFIMIAGVTTVLLIGGSVMLNALGQHRRLKARIDKIGERSRPMSVEERAERRIRRSAETGSPILEALANRLLPRPAAFRARLAQTGKKITLGRYMGASLAVAVLAAVVAGVPLGLPWYTVLAVALIAGVGGPHLVVGWLIASRAQQFASLFPDAIDLMVRGLRSGLPVTETVAAAGREMADPVGAEFRRIADTVRLGQPFEDALWDAAKRIDTPEFKFFVISLSVQRETGGNLAETLANLSDILRSRKQMRLKIRAMSSEAKASALILGGLPFMMFGIIYFLSPDYEQALFTDVRGRVMLGAVLSLMTVGCLVMRKMVRFEI